VPSSQRTYSLLERVNVSDMYALEERGEAALLLLPLCEVRDEERKGRVDPPLLEVRLELGLDTLVEVVKLRVRRCEQRAWQ